ncbi:hypothetical protein OAA07_00775 [bacterium]|nr:hypothetical protein [bacterium]
MLRSKPRKICSPCCRTILKLKNNSEYAIAYYAYSYHDDVVLNKEIEGTLEINAGVGGGIGGRQTTNFVPGEHFRGEESVIQPNETRYVRVGDSKNVLFKYYYKKLQIEFTEEQRNFNVCDNVWFVQPTEEQIEDIKVSNNSVMKRNEEKRELYLKQEPVKKEDERREEEPVKKEDERREEEEPVKKEQLRVKNQEQILKAAQDILISMPCASTYQHMCKKVGKSTQCPNCKHFYCDWHSQTNNSLFGGGGHVCY